MSLTHLHGSRSSNCHLIIVLRLRTRAYLEYLSTIIIRFVGFVDGTEYQYQPLATFSRRAASITHRARIEIVWDVKPHKKLEY